MRGLVTTAAGLIVVVLVASQPPAAFAQVEEPATFSPVSGTVVGQTGYTSGGGTREGEEQPGLHVEWEEDGVSYGQGVIIEQQVEWSDSRLPAQHWVRLDYTTYGSDDPESGVMAVRTSHLLDGADGVWRGTGRAFETSDDRYSYYELTGEGAFEGLHALLRGTPGRDAHGPWDWSYEGWIFEGDTPSFPEPVEPATWEGFTMLAGPMPDESPEGEPQEAPDPMAPSAFTFTLELMGEPEWGTEHEREDGTTVDELGYRSIEQVEAGDPRASGVLTTAMNRTQVEVDDGGVQTVAARMRLTNDGGSWSGSDHGVFAFAEGVFAGSIVTLLTGEGGYDGLTLILGRSWETDADRSWGVIVPSDAVPPMPDAIDPTAES
jgi:hypothetical protein